MMDLTAQLNELSALPPAKLRAKWRELFRKTAPDLTPDLLRRSIAWRLQERRHGGLTPAVKKQIMQAQKRLAARGGAGVTGQIALKPGTRLVREWNDKSYHVLVCDEGFEFKDRHYRSLSQIAEEITGAHWSGPRFFGLKKRSGFKPKALINV